MSILLKKKYPLRIHIATLFLIVVLVSCGSLSFLFYNKSAEIVNAEAEKKFASIIRQVTSEFESVMAPPNVIVSLMALHDLVKASNASDRVDSASFLSEVLDKIDTLSSLYVGYPDGDFFLLRKLKNEEDRNNIQAPERTVWAVQSINRFTDKQTKSHYLFLDKHMRILNSRTWETHYDPRDRGWYKKAQESRGTERSRPYVFFTDRKVGMTFSKKSQFANSVVGVDIRLETLSLLLKTHKITPNSEAVLFDDEGKLIAYENLEKMIVVSEDDPEKLVRGRLTNLGIPALSKMYRVWKEGGSTKIEKAMFESDSRKWLSTVVQLDLKAGTPIFLSIVVPYDELMAEVTAIKNNSIITAVVLFFIMIPLCIGIARGLAKPINRLSDEANAARRFDFDSNEIVGSSIREVDRLEKSMGFMKKTISDFLSLIESLNREKNFDSLLERIGSEARSAAEAEGVCVYLLDEAENVLTPSKYCDAEKGFRDKELPTLKMNESSSPLITSIKDNKVTSWHIKRNNPSGMDSILSKTHDGTTIWCLPLNDRQNNSMGVIALIYNGSPEEVEVSNLEDRLVFVQRLSALAGVTLETKQLIKTQKEMFDSFIKLIAGAIDAKSPYTGGHCQRVPAIAKMLAQAACEKKDGPFKDYDLSEEEWEELHVASWLHDCGKVTTPEYVVDKSTKLETIYDRIHEVRMRFEVLKRDEEIKCWQAISEGGDKDSLLEGLSKVKKELDDDFVFIAKCNQGGEFLAKDAIDRLHQIAERTWQRTIDDRIGISWVEKERKEREKAQELPTEEKLLSDKKEHLIPRNDSEPIFEDNNPWGFKLEVPEHLYNRGELYNLAVSRGTLSDEERFKINDHIVQTIKMLSKLNYPKHLQNVPEIAGGHHETTTGSGYPRKLTGDQMSTTAKMMVIADVFEALTASDRPYKHPKKLSEAVKIMGFMHKDGHFDTDLYHLFLSSGVYKEYGQQFLEASQIDDVNVEDII